jgi:hypothetical protein
MAMSPDEAQAILGVRPGAGKADVLKAYKSLALKHHTDRGGEREIMVEINVAKDVLLSGKSIRYKKQENPEARQRDADLATLMKLRETVVPAANAARVDAGTESFSHKVNLRDYITNDLADVCDAIEDTAAEVAADTQQSALTRERAKQIGAAVKAVLASALKLASKYGSIFKVPLSIGSVSYAEAEKAYKLREKFIPALQATYKESRKLNSLLTGLVGTLDDEYQHPIPADLADQYFECQDMIGAFVRDYGSASMYALDRFETAMKSTHDEASQILKRHGLSDGLPADWKQWRIPEDIDEAIDALRVFRRAG